MKAYKIVLPQNLNPRVTISLLNASEIELVAGISDRVRQPLWMVTPPVNPHKYASKVPNSSPDLEDTVGVVNDGVNFGFVADDPRIGEQFLNFRIVVAGNQFDIKIIKRLTEIFPFTQDGIPTQSSLHPIQCQEFKQHPVIMQRLSPLFVMIAGEERIVEIPLTTGNRSVDHFIHMFILPYV